MNDERPTMHCQDELERDLAGHTLISDALMRQWYDDAYSVSKHVYSLYSLPRGLNARHILEIGFGRSSFVLARAAAEAEGHFYTCDTRDFSYLLSEEEQATTTFIHGRSDEVWANEEIRAHGVDFAFLDYFSGAGRTPAYIAGEIKACLRLMKTNGIIAIHDATHAEFEPIRKALRKVNRSSKVELLVLPFQFGLALLRYKGPSPYGVLGDSWGKKP